MAKPSREEIIAYATQVAQRNGLDPEVFLRVIEGESSFNPDAIGDNGKSKGLAQLFTGGGEGNLFQERYGMDPGTDWMKDLDFMGERVAKGGSGYQPWHAAANAGIGDFQGVPGQKSGTPGNQGRRDRGISPTPSPTWAANAQRPQNTADATDMFGMTPEERLNAWNPKGAHTLGGKLTDLLGITDPEARKYDYQGKKGRPRSLLAAAFGSSHPYEDTDERDTVARKLMGDRWNPFAPVSDEVQAKAIQDKKNKPTTLAGMFLKPNPTDPKASPAAPKNLLGYFLGS